MEEIFSNVVTALFACVGVVIAVGIMWRFASDIFTGEKTVFAEVCDKQSYEDMVYGKKQAPHLKHMYVVVFLCGKRKMHFDVSETSYQSYRVGQKGKLTYKGRRLLDFKRTSVL